MFASRGETWRFSRTETANKSWNGSEPSNRKNYKANRFLWRSSLWRRNPFRRALNERPDPKRSPLDSASVARGDVAGDFAGMAIVAGRRDIRRFELDGFFSVRPRGAALEPRALGAGAELGDAACASSPTSAAESTVEGQSGSPGRGVGMRVRRLLYFQPP